MPFRFPLQHAFALAAGASLLIPATSAFAQDEAGGWRNGSWYGADAPPPPPSVADDRRAPPPPPPHDERRYAPPSPHQARYDDHGYDDGDRDHRGYERRDHGREDYARPQFDPSGRQAWLADCRSRISARDDGVGGAVIGGVVGGVAGNRIAGRGQRTVGTLGGAAVGAVAGSAIDRAEDRGRANDECEAYLDDYYARYTAGGYAPAYPGPAYSATYAPVYGYPNGGGCCGAPVMMVPAPVQPQPECTETVEYVYEDVPVRRRPVAIKRTRIVHDKRVKIVPDKRISVK